MRPFCQMKNRRVQFEPYHKNGRNMYRIFVFLAFLGVSSAAFAGEDPLDVTKPVERLPVESICSQEIRGKKLTLPDVVNLALCNNPQTRQSYLTAMSAAADYGQAQGDYMPTVGLTAGLSQSNTEYQKSSDRNTASANASLTLDWLLYDFGGRSAAVEKMKEALNMALFSRSDVLQSLIFDVTKAYYQLLAAEEEYKNSQATVASAASAYDAASKRYELGLVALSDKLQAETSYSQAQLTEAKAEEALALAKGHLAVLLNYPPQESFLLEPADYTQAEEKFDGKVEEMLKIALEKRADIIAKRAELKQALANIEYEKSRNAPSFSVSGGLEATDDLRKAGENDYATRVGLSMTVPLFTGFKNTYRITQSRYQAGKTTAELKKLENDVQSDVWDTFQTYQTARKSYAISLTLFASAEQNEKVALGAYKAGKGSMLNLLDAQSKLADARTSKSRSFYEMLIAKNNLIRTMGLINPFKPKKGF